MQLVCDVVREYRPVVIAPETPPPTARCLLITIAQTENGPEDRVRLYRLLDIIRRYPGADEVRLAISTEEGLVNLEMPNITTNYCPELREQLAELVGEEGLILKDKF